MNVVCRNGGEVHASNPVVPDWPLCRTGGQNGRGSRYVATDAPVTCQKCGPDPLPDLIDLDSGDEYEWRGDGYAHEGDHDFAWSRAELESQGQRLAEVASLSAAELAALRARLISQTEGA